MEAEDWEDLLHERLESFASDFEEVLSRPEPTSRRRAFAREFADDDRDDVGFGRRQSSSDTDDVIARAQRVREQIGQLMELHETTRRERPTRSARSARPVRASRPRSVKHTLPRTDDKLKRAVLLLILSELL